jgi:hypothetical protein
MRKLEVMTLKESKGYIGHAWDIFPGEKILLPFMIAWMHLEDLTLSEINQAQKDKCCVISQRLNSGRAGAGGGGNGR